MKLKKVLETKKELLAKVKESIATTPKNISNGSNTINLAVTGRVESWLENSESRYPQSCTVISVEDSMEGLSGIEYSWLFVSKGLRYGAGVALDLSKLRPKGVDNGRGLVSSGICSFMEIYSKQNEILRRGGTYKNGAVVAFCTAFHPDAVEFINYPEQRIPWLKRALYVNDNPSSPEYILNHPQLDKILSAVRDGRLWLSKMRWEEPSTKELVNYPIDPTDPYKYRVFGNVCQEILIPSRGTCLLSHVNLGKCTLVNLVQSFRESMRFLCKLHAVTGAGKDNFYLSPKEDRQVGLGVVGLANLLAKMKISYKDFADCLYDWFSDEKIVEARGSYTNILYITKVAKDLGKEYTYKTIRLVAKFYQAFKAAAKIARQYNMVRAFTLAPTASSSYRHLDSNGFTLAPEISPPICHPETKSSTRDSDTFGQLEYKYPPNVETAEQVGWDTYYKLTKAWQMLMNSTGLAHSMSVNIWNQCPVDELWLKDWLDSPLVTTYYRMVVDQSFNDKSNIEAGIHSSLIESTQDFFASFNDTLNNWYENKEQDYFKTALDTVNSNVATAFEVPESTFCELKPTEDGGFCSACAETL